MVEYDNLILKSNLKTGLMYCGFALKKKQLFGHFSLGALYDWTSYATPDLSLAPVGLANLKSQKIEYHIKF